MRCEVGAFEMRKRRKTRAMRRGKERGAAPKMSGRLGSPGRRIRKEGNYGPKAAVFCAKVLHFCAKVPLFSTRSAMLRRAVLDFAPEVEHLSSDERVLSFRGFVRRGGHVPYLLLVV